MCITHYLISIHCIKYFQFFSRYFVSVERNEFVFSGITHFGCCCFLLKSDFFPSLSIICNKHWDFGKNSFESNFLLLFDWLLFCFFQFELACLVCGLYQWFLFLYLESFCFCLGIIVQIIQILICLHVTENAWRSFPYFS